MPISGSLLTFTVAFSTADFTSGLLTYTSTTPYLATYGITPSNVTETIRVYSPADQWGTPFGSASINIGTTTTTQFALPKSGGVVIQGQYLVVVTAVVTGGVTPGTYTTPDMLSLYHDFCPGSLVLAVSAETNCVCAELVVTDNTSYTGWTQGATVMNLIGPIITGTSPIYTITTAGPTVGTSGQDLYDSTYTWNISKTLTNGNTTLVLTARGNVTPDCADFCHMLCALKKADALVTTDAASRAKLPSLMLAWSKFNLAYDSQRCNPAYVTPFMDQFWDQMLVFGIKPDCDDCAPCSSTGGIIHPLCGSGGSSTITLSNTSPTWFVVNQVGNAATIGPSPQAIDYLASIRTYSVTSNDGSVGITPTLVPGSATTPPSTSYDLSAEVVNQMSFFYTENFLAGTAAITNLTRKGGIWKFPYVNPTVSPAMVTWLSVMEVSNLFNVPQDFKVDVRIVSQSAIKALSPQTGLNSVIAVELADLPTTGTGSDFSLQFFDVAGTDPFYRDIPIGYNNLGAYLESMTLQITIYQ